MYWPLSPLVYNQFSEYGNLLFSSCVPGCVTGCGPGCVPGGVPGGGPGYVPGCGPGCVPGGVPGGGPGCVKLLITDLALKPFPLCFYCRNTPWVRVLH
ncbi:hypothetical protein ADH66_05655 [Acutalibacter muris]|uniref:Uncharacterized protein n=1 Tax=Acutalibacter muris TaxID=1796620 RepID=A0ABN5A094_9FIRM|nr:hypothetical protein A4V00_19385 [Hungateiclostridiaceae bacterium KB18]ASB40189.1 hypothetical protein ADH66_05655 [Acutalibacter muris]